MFPKNPCSRFAIFPAALNFFFSAHPCKCGNTFTCNVYSEMISFKAIIFLLAAKWSACNSFLCAICMPGIIILIHSICASYLWYDTQCLYFVSMIHNVFIWYLWHALYIYVRIKSLILCIVHPIPSIFVLSNYYRNDNIGRLVTVSSRNLWPQPAYVQPSDLTELPDKFDHDRSKTENPVW